MRPDRARPVDHVLVVVPAHDESERIGPTLDALARARSEVAAEVSTSLVVVADACRDATGAVARLRLQTPPDRVVDSSTRCVGSARRLGVEAGLSDIRVPADRVWLASTDADTCVPPDWLQVQLQHAATGLHAVSGTVALIDDEDRTPHLADAFAADYAKLIDGDRHGHVHGASMGVRADAYLDVGGWASLVCGEDHDLWGRLLRGGWQAKGVVDLEVDTSARTTARAPDGFAADIAALAATVA